MDEMIDKEPIVQDAENQTTQEEPTTTEADTAKMADEATPETDTSAEVSATPTDWQDKYLRLVAEFDNYRKRTLKEKMDLIATGGEEVIKDLLSVMDDLDRAMGAIEKATDMEAMKGGVVLIQQKLMETLKNKGLTEIEAVGEELDTDLHEAVAKFPAGEEKQGKIIDVVQKGYKLKDKVVRYAKVVVGE